jgi:tetratricopeptide (TPR) repeat protein
MRSQIRKRHHYRRPVYQPSKVTRLIELVKSFRKQLTLKRVVFVAVGLPLLFYIYGEATHDALIIDPFSVPKSFEEIGLTPEVIANRIGDAMRQIESGAQQKRMKTDSLTSLHDEGSRPDVEIPGTKVGLKTVVEIVRGVFRINPRHVSGDIVIIKGGESSTTKPQFKITVYITQGRNRSQPISLAVTANDMDMLAQDSAEMILREVNPYILAAYLYDHGETDKVIEILYAMVRDPAQDRDHIAAARNLLGNALVDEGRDDEAVTNYQKAIELDPKHAFAYYDWGLLLYDQENYSEAVSKYQKAIELDPQDPDAYNELGNVFVQQKRYDEAVTKYQKAAELDPKDADVYNNWGNMLVGQKRYEEAVVKYQKAIEVDPKSPDAYNNWGDMLAEQKKYDEAVVKYQKAIEVDPKDGTAYSNWGNMLAEQKKYDEAIAKFQKAIEADPNAPDAYKKWGNVLKEQKKYAEAEEKLAKARGLSK